MIKWCKECKIGVEVSEEDEPFWNFCHICGCGLEWMDEDDLYKEDNITDSPYFKKDLR